jgi:hypothetical protein
VLIEQLASVHHFNSLEGDTLQGPEIEQFYVSHWLSGLKKVDTIVLFNFETVTEN